MKNFKPFVAKSKASSMPLGGMWAVLAPTFEGYLVVGSTLSMPGLTLRVQVRTVMKWELMRNYDVMPNYSLQSLLEAIKAEALDGGAIPEAIRLMLDNGVQFKKKELKKMSKKLKGDKKAKGGKKAAATKGGSKKSEGKKRGRAPAGNRKYTSVKVGDMKLREGTWTEYMAKTIASVGSTDAANAKHEKSSPKEYAEKRLDFKWAEGKGYITFKD